MGRRTLLLLALVVPALAACAVPGTDAAEIEDCADEFLVGVRMGNPDGAFDDDDVKDRVRPFCEALIEAGLSGDSSEAEVIAFLKESPGVTGEMCEVSALTGDVDEIVAAYGGYVSRDNVERLGRDSCVYAVTEGYGSFVTGFDMAAVIRAHPYLAAPFCRAPLMQAYDRKTPPQPRRVYEDVVTDACMEGIRTGVVDYRAGIALKPMVDERRFRKLLDAEWAKRA
jgi:hypothetical protein